MDTSDPPGVGGIPGAPRIPSPAPYSIVQSRLLTNVDRKRCFYGEERHTVEEEREEWKEAPVVERWRMKERMKTVSVGLVLCLNISVDPPDVVKPNPCARLECWIDPLALASQKALEQIGKAIQAQYERWQPRARYKPCLDPTVEDVKKTCLSLRRNAKEERVLFHYNGHGVPRPTANGEIWVFNKNYTQYIPLSIFDLHSWLGTPAIFVFDCSAAGTIMNAFLQFAERTEQSLLPYMDSASPATLRDVIILAASAAGDLLPVNPMLPADLFTSCLTTPIKTALRWFCVHSRLATATFDMIDKIPGRLTDRKTPLGELNWIFTAITDTIAWNVLPQEVFQRLFRQDLLVASLFRNFLLADRIMRSTNTTPLSYPKLPSTAQHPLWNAWDLAADICLTQLPRLLETPHAEFHHNPFFGEQLTAFEVWLEFGSPGKRPPEQLPVVLQVLLSQVHRLRALVLLGRFVDMGPWAINLALSVGIFPYVLKLLQSPSPELREILIFIWAKILAHDKSCQVDIVKDNGHEYFISFLSTRATPSSQRCVAAFVLTAIVNNFRPGQGACLSGRLLSVCLSQLGDPDSNLRKWLCLCMGKLWDGFDEARLRCLQENGLDAILGLLNDPQPEVRSAALFCLGTFMGGSDEDEQKRDVELRIGVAMTRSLTDASPLVRKELAIAIARVVTVHERGVQIVAEDYEDRRKKIVEMIMEDRKKSGQMSEDVKQKVEALSREKAPETAHMTIFRGILVLASDPYPGVSRVAISILQKFSQAARRPATTQTPEPATLRRSRSMQRIILDQGGPSPSSQSSSLMKKVQSMDFSKLNIGAEAFGNKKMQNLSRSPPLAPQRGSPASVASPEVIQPSALPEWDAYPFVSQLYEWQSYSFGKPQMQQATEDMHSAEAIEVCKRSERNKRLVEETIHYVESFELGREKRRADDLIAILDNESAMTSFLCFFEYDPLLAVADERSGISIWKYEVGRRETWFSNHNPEGTRITSLSLLNETASPLLLVGTDDGVLRLWRNTHTGGIPVLTTAWRAMPDLVPGQRGSGLLAEWQQGNGQLITGGACSLIRTWDVEKEMCISELPTQTDSMVTSMTSDQLGGRLLIVGCGDGSIRLFDCRVEPQSSQVAALTEHSGWVVNVHLQRGGERHLVSGSVAGDIKFWDLSNFSTSRMIDAHKSSMTALVTHDYAPLVASGSNNQFIKVFRTDGECLSMIRYHDGFLGQRIGPISALAFHPLRPLFAAGATDAILSIYSAAGAKK